MGLFKIIYRYPRYHYLVSAGSAPQDNLLDTVDSLGEYGAQLQLTILLIQAGVYALVFLVLLFRCKNAPDAEPEQIKPEEDAFA